MTYQEMTVWIVGLLLAAMVLCAPAACTANRHTQIAEAIKAGADPTAAKCAIESDTASKPVCIIAAMRSKQVPQ